MSEILSANPTKLVVVIDDDPQVAQSLELTLARAGYRTQAATSAFDGMGLLWSLEEVACVIVDTTLRDMPGFEIASRLKNNPKTSHVPVVLVSTPRGPKDRRASNETKNFLTKPLRPSDVVGVLRQLGV